MDISLQDLVEAIASRVVQKLLAPEFEHIGGTISLKALDPRRFAQFVCAAHSGEFYNRHLYNKPYFPNYLDHVAHMARSAKAIGDGLFLEFGVASGASIRVIANAVQSQVFGFDSFNGLPEDWREGVPKGAFATQIPDLPASVSLEIGMIEDTLRPFLERTRPTSVRFIHIDTDLYAPAKFILESIAPYIEDAVVVFDEFYNYAGYEEHEFRAFAEFQTDHADAFEIRYMGSGGSVAVSARITRKPA